MKTARLSMLAGMLAGLGILAGCQTSQRARPFANHAEAVVAQLRPERAWNVVHADEVAGVVVLFRAEGDPGRAFYSVRNPWQQELGMIDALGRIWRFRPHEPEPEWVGSGTVNQGAARILDLAPGASLEEVAIEELLADGGVE